MRYWELPRSAGVYIIENHTTGYIYIGSARNMMSRGSQHFHDLKGMKHCNRVMQMQWDEQIENQFTIQVLEHCHANDLRDKEQAWIDKYLSESKPLYNRTLRIPDRQNKTPEWKDYAPTKKKRFRSRWANKRRWY